MHTRRAAQAQSGAPRAYCGRPSQRDGNAGAHVRRPQCTCFRAPAIRPAACAQRRAPILHPIRLVPRRGGRAPGPEPNRNLVRPAGECEPTHTRAAGRQLGQDSFPSARTLIGRRPGGLVLVVLGILRPLSQCTTTGRRQSPGARWLARRPKQKNNLIAANGEQPRGAANSRCAKTNGHTQ